ncbi:hypothetical protein GGTG_09581 [Gaeumannomyces tritici R3-111a-1]|uniref:Uncharacterized protein n=1 Tax=Gaeumannomyces tritici (strain R3-111a-1) TaxID=644352 RepID=J3P7U0_GAET3|nr:hypothetical protein GGTG_09581 [Gaeumannomyces tritici R3-111a-1]EJT72723.1 hypothetical protein GGTG_09581 [Gaeumannomyces tritici R3-111a-1]
MPVFGLACDSSGLMGIASWEAHMKPSFPADPVVVASAARSLGRGFEDGIVTSPSYFTKPPQSSALVRRQGQARFTEQCRPRQGKLLSA